jgi:16S rRNA (cytosine967-C5)-methyltransferase
MLISNPRQMALKALNFVQQGTFADVALDRVFQQGQLSAVDRRLCTELVYGCVRRQRTLDALIDQLASQSIALDAEVRLILRLGLYQLRFLTQVPAAAAVHTTVELVKQNRQLSRLSGFVNAILRQYLRLTELQGEPLITPTDPLARLGLLQSYPEWILQVWAAQLDPSELESLCEWFNRPPHLDLRINPLRTSIETVLTAMNDADISATTLPGLPQAVRILKHSGSIQQVPGFKQGWWMVQDSSAQLVSHFLDPQPGEVILDACAAPGGKTTHLAELMSDQGVVRAFDRTPSRLKRLRENISRLGLTSIQVEIGDSRQLPQLNQTADRVLLDAPCSGLGTLHRHADARWRQTPDSVAQLTQLQLELLSKTAEWVKPGGILVYATCTLHPAENENCIQTFLQNHNHWQIQPLPTNHPWGHLTSPQGWLKLWPHRHQMDGFFMVKLQQKKIKVQSLLD